MTAPPREQCPKVAIGELCSCYSYGKGADYCPFAAPAPSAAQPAEPPATDADRLVHDLRAIAIDFAGDHQVDNTCRAAADLIEQQAREIAELQRKLTNEENYYEDMKIRAGRAEAERDALREDAERYRWLRDHKGNNREPHIAQHPYCAEIDAVEYPYFVKVGLDAAIDAARAKVKLD